ncbi:hypothetical protein TAMA11512_13580 [Selenomonas sp. TAMA-11512]|uniref:C40 family peptidase n=1 Tax=Selenomonas sp. TAMA-11512 TaxID=3095337 RepID=UPI00308C0E28|nr:hypothetical protein TAMA11512_13580 [Selenomonas sp. TAMA-11512]
MMHIVRSVLLACLLMAVPLTTTQAAAILSENSHGQEVVRLQKELIRTGYLKDHADGIFGSATKAAVLAFQRDQELNATGIVDRATWQKLKNTSPKSTSTADVNIALKPASKANTTKRPTGKNEPADASTTKPSTTTKEAKPAKTTTKENKTATTSKSSKKIYTIKPLPPGKTVAYNQTFFDKKSVSNLISTAKKYIGVPYQFGGNTPKAFDCSGYLQYVFQENGFAIPRLADDQYKLGKTTKTKKELEPGDLVFFETYEKGASHCGIYLGKDEFIHASSSKGVRIDKLTDAYWQPRYYGGKKILK